MVVSPRLAHRESPVGAKKVRLLIWGAVLSLALVTCAVLAWALDIGTVGFAIGAVAVLVVASAALCLRELRRANRALKRLENERRQSRRQESEIRKSLTRLEKNAETERARRIEEQRSARELGKIAATQLALLNTVLATQRELGRSVSESIRTDGLQAQLSTQLRQQQAMLNLFSIVPVRDVVPNMGGWAASADVVSLLVGDLLRIRPRLVVECGSGVSTLWTALAIEHHRLECRVVSLDHDPYFAEQTRATLRAHGVDRHVEVRDAPLVPAGVPGHDTAWYNREQIADLHDIGLLFVDGPPDDTGPLVRFPAIPLLKERLAATATVVLDDLIRAGEKEVVARWRLQLPDFEVEELPLQKAAAVFRRMSSQERG